MGADDTLLDKGAAIRNNCKKSVAVNIPSAYNVIVCIEFLFFNKFECEDTIVSELLPVTYHHLISSFGWISLCSLQVT